MLWFIPCNKIPFKTIPVCWSAKIAAQNCFLRSEMKHCSKLSSQQSNQWFWRNCDMKEWVGQWCFVSNSRFQNYRKLSETGPASGIQYTLYLVKNNILKTSLRNIELAYFYYIKVYTNRIDFLKSCIDFKQLLQFSYFSAYKKLTKFTFYPTYEKVNMNLPLSMNCKWNDSLTGPFLSFEHSKLCCFISNI